MKTYRIITFGCKVNQYDSQLWRALLASSGLYEAGDGEAAELCLVNTCTVTAAASQQARQAIRKIKKQSQQTKIVVAGCYGQVAKAALDLLPETGLVVGRYSDETAVQVSGFLGLPRIQASEGISAFAHHTRAFLKVQDGCDHRCSYCVVPLARGRSRSRPLSQVIAEAQRLATAGHQEIVVTGVRLGDFKPSLRTLLLSLEDIPGIERLRLSSLEPDDLDEGTINAIAGSHKIARHLHLPLQSGDDRMLRLMNRPYDMKYFSGLLAKAQQTIPEMTFGTDIIAGFPGETEEQFNHSCLAVEGLPITHLHVFTYSKRAGTVAATLGGQIPEQIRQERSARLRQQFERKQRRYWESRIGTETPVLFEDQKDGCWSGLGEHYFRVSVASDRPLANQLLKVKLNAANDAGMSGELADQAGTS